MRVEVTAFGHQIMSRRYAEAVDRAKNLRPAFLEVYERFRELEQIHFGREGAGPSGPWAELEESTVERKALSRKHGMVADPRILHEKLRLRPSLTRRGSRYAIFRTRNNELVMGTSHPQAKRHMRGTPGGQMVARPPIDLYEGDKREMVLMIQDYMMRTSHG